MTTDQIDKLIEQWKEKRQCFTYPSGLVVSVTTNDLLALVRAAVEAERERCEKSLKGLDTARQCEIAIRNRKALAQHDAGKGGAG